MMGRCEPPRVCPRPQLLRRWSDEQDNKFSPEVRVRAVVLGHEQEASVTVAGDRLNSWLQGFLAQPVARFDVLAVGIGLRKRQTATKKSPAHGGAEVIRGRLMKKA